MCDGQLRCGLLIRRKDKEVADEGESRGQGLN